VILRQWLIRIGLTVGAFFVGTYAAFFLLFLVTWDQGVLDFFMMAAGISLSAVTFFSTRHITQPVVEPYKPHHKRLATAYGIAVVVAGVLVTFADQPRWQIAMLAVSSAVAYWLIWFTRNRPSPES